jgi:hypothetical protein
MGYLLGYARVCTADQQPHLQVDALERAGCYRVFTEAASGARADRPTLNQVLDQLRPGDTLAVWKLDRLGRSLRHLVDTDAIPFRTAISNDTEDGRDVFCWSTEDPPLHARYRLEWRFRARDHEDAGEHRASDTMRALGIVQEGDPILTRPARPFVLPEEAEDARRVVAELHSAAARIAEVHTFGKGLGIAAPQIGIDRAAAIVRPPSRDTITLLNRGSWRSQRKLTSSTRAV